MKISKLQGTACLLAAKRVAEGDMNPTSAADHFSGPLTQIGWCADDKEGFNDWFDYDTNDDYCANEVILALAMCATVACK